MPVRILSVEHRCDHCRETVVVTDSLHNPEGWFVGRGMAVCKPCYPRLLAEGIELYPVMSTMDRIMNGCEQATPGGGQESKRW